MKQVTYQGKVWNKEKVQAMIAKSDESLRRALLIVYANQTNTEQACGFTVNANGVGFSKFDDSFLTDVAKKVTKYGSFASAKQANAVRKCMKKYWRQVLDHIAAKASEVTVTQVLANDAEYLAAVAAGDQDTVQAIHETQMELKAALGPDYGKDLRHAA